MLEEPLASLRATRLENGTGDPTMVLVIVGVGALQVGEAAVLRLEGGLQVGGVVDRMGPGIAGEHLEVIGEALREIKG